MNRWQRFWMRRVSISYFASEDGSVGNLEADLAAEITEEIINEVANNGDTQKRLLARMYLENKAGHEIINGKIDKVAIKTNFHDKFIWALIITGITGVVGGLIALVYYAVRHFLMGG